MMERASALLFAAFVSFAAIAALSGGKKRRIRWFIAFSAVAIVGPGILHREAWPFSRWQLFAYRYHPPVERVTVRAVDTAGIERDIDRRAWEPFSNLDLHTWIYLHWKDLSGEERDTAARYLLDLVNRARDDALAGRQVGVYGRYFGTFAAPLHFVFRPIWLDAASTPPLRFAVLRIYHDSWDVEERARDSRNCHRELIYEGPK